MTRQLLYNYILKSNLEKYPSQSRIHPINHFQEGFFLKREDELGGIWNGSKWRKYLSLIPHLVQSNIEKVFLIGSASSNNLLSMTPLLKEKGIESHYILKKSHAPPTGNALFLKLYTKEEQICWVDGKEWNQADQIADTLHKQEKKNSCVIPEGATLSSSIPGLLTLPIDILRNEEEGNLSFKQIFIDSGTGYTAATLILGLAIANHSAEIHVGLMAQTPKQFQDTLNLLYQNLQHSIKFPFPTNFKTYQPEKLKSFGSTSKQLFQSIKKEALELGILLDPIYNAKMWLLLKSLCKKKTFPKDSLLIHSGGTSALSGFLPKII